MPYFYFSKEPNCFAATKTMKDG